MRRRVVRADELVMVGERIGMRCAESIYLALAQEPIDGDGQRVDWLIIQAQILTARRSPPARV